MNLAKILEKHYPVHEKKAARMDKLSPSRITKCPRGAVMDSLGYGEPKEFSSEINFGFGTMRHESIQGIFNDKNLLKETELYVDMDDPPVHGFIDGILDTDPPKILEIKTIGKPLTQVKSPLEDHIDQATLYMYMTGIDEAILLYETKNEQNKKDGNPWKQFTVEYEEERAARLLKKARYILSCLEEKKLPFPAPKCYCRNPYCYNNTVQKKEGFA